MQGARQNKTRGDNPSDENSWIYEKSDEMQHKPKKGNKKARKY
jgi:hypothetical protein